MSLSLFAFSQDNAQEVLETLCSENFHGRGYVKKGDKKACCSKDKAKSCSKGKAEAKKTSATKEK